MEILFWFMLATAIVFEITCISLVFTKADKPGWGGIVPIYGIILLCDIAEKPRWWTLLCLIPFVNILACIVLSIGVARHFDKSDAFGVGLVLLPVVFYAILAFGDAEYDTYDSPEQTMPAEKTASASRPTRPQQRVTPVSSPVTRPQREVASSSDSVKLRPRAAKCPFCRSRTFSVVEEAGSRRCSDCHSVLPSYVLGTE